MKPNLKQQHKALLQNTALAFLLFILLSGASFIIVRYFVCFSSSSNAASNSISQPWINRTGNPQYPLLISSIITASIISLLFGLVLTSFVKIREKGKELKTILSTIHNLILLVDNKGRILKVIQANKELLYKPENEIIGRTVSEIFDPELAAYFNNSLQQCFDTKTEVELEYSLNIGDQKRWFNSRLIYQSQTEVVVSADDITDRKTNEKNLKDSAQQMQEMNAIKDRFFSIIAHDLRSPVGSFKMLTGILLKDFEKADPEKSRQMLTSIHLASSSLYDLLENLLSWSHNQRKTLTLNKQNHQLFDLVDDAIDSQLIHAELKDICIKNEITDDELVLCDQYVTLTIIRNLISNAIKFTPKKGKINITSDLTETGAKTFRKISVRDNGIGMPAEKLQDIFSLDLSKSSLGTNNESGSGLGLVLCKEFLEKQDGMIEIESIENAGTTVSIYLPYESETKRALL